MKLKFVFYTDNVSVEGQGALRGEWMVEGEEGKCHRKRKPQLCNEVVKVTGGHFVVEETENVREGCFPEKPC